MTFKQFQNSSSQKRIGTNIWKSTTFFLIFVSTIFAVLYLKSSAPSKQFNQQSPIRENSVVVENSPPNNQTNKFGFPSDKFYINQGMAWISDVKLYSENDYFEVSLEKNIDSQEKHVSPYRVPISNVDSIHDPKISHSYTYGCVTIGISGHSGYFIFELSTGKEVDRGVQYSSCIEWIDGNRVIVLEKEYFSENYEYYILTVPSMKKQTISTSKFEMLSGRELPLSN